MTRKLRISGHKDYVAVDVVKRGRIVDTPFYLRTGENRTIQYYDLGIKRPVQADVCIAEDFSHLVCKSNGFEWSTEFDELLLPRVITFEGPS